MNNFWLKNSFVFLYCLLLVACTHIASTNDISIDLTQLPSSTPYSSLDTPTPTVFSSITPTPTLTQSVYVLPGLGEGIAITEQAIDIHYEDLDTSLSPGLYVIYETLNIANNGDLNYEIWGKAQVGGQTIKLLDCQACPFVIGSLEADVSGSLKILAREAGTEQTDATVLVFDMSLKQSRMVSCQSNNPGKNCNLMLFAGRLVAFTEDASFINVELTPSQWVTITGEIFNSQEWNYQFFPNGEIMFLPNTCDATNSISVKFNNDTYTVEQLLPLRNVCEFDTSPLMLGQSSSSAESKVAYVIRNSGDPLMRFSLVAWGLSEYGQMTWIYVPDDSLVVCSSESLYTQAIGDCYKIVDNLEAVLPYNINKDYKFGWLDDFRFLWEKPRGMTDGQIIGTLDLNGTLRTLYQGESISYQISPDGKWLLYEMNNTYGVMSTTDGSTVYLPLPEAARKLTWLLIP